jgi:predicted NBD/HSP70 family sugar kinase
MADPTVAILETLATRGPADRAWLAEATGFSPATVGRAVSRLRRDGIVREWTGTPTGLGRPPRFVELDGRSAFVVGIDAGGHTLRAAVGDFHGTIRTRTTRPIRDPTDREALLGDIVALVDEVAASSERSALRAVVVGVSGIVDHAGDRVLLSPDLPGLDGGPLAAVLQERLGVLAAIDNDDLLAAVGEASAGAAIGCHDVVFLSLGYGLGAGLIIGGRPVRGASNAAGAIAYLAPGRLADRASGRAIPARYRAALFEDRAAQAYLAQPVVDDARVVFQLATAGDPVARRVIAEVVAEIGDLVIDVAALLNPEVIVVGGGLADAGRALFEPLDQRLQTAIPYPPRLVPSALGDAAVLHGAISLALALARRGLAGSDQPRRKELVRPALALL